MIIDPISHIPCYVEPFQLLRIPAPPVSGLGRFMGWSGCIFEVTPSSDAAHIAAESEQVRLLNKGAFNGGPLFTYPDNGTSWTGFNQTTLENRLNNGSTACPDPTPVDYTGWIWVDIESPYWMPWRIVNEYSDADAQLVYDEMFEPAIATLIALRPQAKVGLYSMCTTGPDDPNDPSGLRWELAQAMHAPCVGISNSFFRNGNLSFNQNAAVTQNDLETAFIMRGLQDNKPIFGWIRHRYSGGNGTVLDFDGTPMVGSAFVNATNLDAWFSIWAAWNIEGFIHLEGDGDPDLPSQNNAIILCQNEAREALDETLITLPA